MASGWIKLHRKLLEWEWYDDKNTMRLWIHILLKVNHEPKKWHGVDVLPGTFITSYSSLSEETGLSIKKIRLSLDKLENSGNVARKTTNKWQAVTVMNWELYQSCQDETASNETNKGQTKGKQRATTKEYKNIRSKEDKNNIPPISPLDVFQEYAKDDSSLLTALTQFLEMRKKIKKPMTDQAMKLLTEKLDKLASDSQSKIEILNQSILGNWSSVYPLKTDFNQQQKGDISRLFELDKKMNGGGSVFGD